MEFSQNTWLEGINRNLGIPPNWSSTGAATAATHGLQVSWTLTGDRHLWCPGTGYHGRVGGGGKRSVWQHDWGTLIGTYWTYLPIREPNDSQINIRLCLWQCGHQSPVDCSLVVTSHPMQCFDFRATWHRAGTCTNYGYIEPYKQTTPAQNWATCAMQSTGTHIRQHLTADIASKESL